MAPDEVNRRVHKVLRKHWLGEYPESVEMIVSAAMVFSRQHGLREYRSTQLKAMMDDIRTATDGLIKAHRTFAAAMEHVRLAGAKQALPHASRKFSSSFHSHRIKYFETWPKLARVASRATKAADRFIGALPEIDDRRGGAPLTRLIRRRLFWDFAREIAAIYVERGRELYREDATDLEDLLCELHEELTGIRTENLPGKDKLFAWLRREIPTT